MCQEVQDTEICKLSKTISVDPDAITCLSKRDTEGEMLR